MHTYLSLFKIRSRLSFMGEVIERTGVPGQSPRIGVQHKTILVIIFWYTNKIHISNILYSCFFHFEYYLVDGFKSTTKILKFESDYTIIRILKCYYTPNLTKGHNNYPYIANDVACKFKLTKDETCKFKLMRVETYNFLTEQKTVEVNF